MPSPVTSERLDERLRRQIDETPDATALESSACSYTYRELDRQAEALARSLRTHEAGNGLVGISCTDPVNAVIGIVGAFKAGRAYLPLDPSYPAARLQHMLTDARCEVVVGDSLEPRLLRQPRRRPAGGRDEELPSDLAYVMYTSGSSGTPKGVTITHENLLSLFDATSSLFEFGADDVWSLFHSYCFDFSVWEIWGALLHGGRLVVVPAELRASPRSLYDLLVRRRVTVLNQVPSVFRHLSRVHAATQADLALRYVIFGGEALDKLAVRRWRDAGSAGAIFVNMYGITETTIHATHRVLGDDDLLDGASTAIGHALPHLAFRVLDAELRPVERGRVGELWISGGGVSPGYLDRPELTAERFVELEPGVVSYRSGDLVRIEADGSLTYHGRCDDQVQLRGFRIELAEIEAACARHPSVEKAVARVSTSVHGEQHLEVFFVASEQIDADDVRRIAALRLPPHMIPARIRQLGELPLTSSGKIDRRALPAPAV